MVYSEIFSERELFLTNLQLICPEFYNFIGILKNQLLCKNTLVL